jgi:hypothetical protein
MPTTEIAEKLYTAKEACEPDGPLPFKPRTLMQYAREDKIGYVRIGVRKIRFREQDIAAYIRSGSRPAGSKPKPPTRNPKYTK